MLGRILADARARYASLAAIRWFNWVVTGVFLLWGLLTIIEIISLVSAFEPHPRRQQAVEIITPLTSKTGDYGFVGWANIIASLVAGLLVLCGIARLRRSRLAAYTMWDHALLVDIFFVQLFAFIRSQFGACLGFVLDIVLLISVRFMTARERELGGDTTTPEEREPAVAPPVPA